MTLNEVNERLVEAARYAVVSRLMPILCHDVAGTMQPVLMLLTVLERRVQSTDPDLVAISKNVTSISTLIKQANLNCINALSWAGSSKDIPVNLHSSVDAVFKLLEMELSVSALTPFNSIADHSATISQSFLRSVFIGALLAFCDQQISPSTLHVTFEAAAADGQRAGHLKLQILLGGAGKPPSAVDVVCKYRIIGWPDVQAMAKSRGVDIAQGDGWLTLDLPKSPNN